MSLGIEGVSRGLLYRRVERMLNENGDVIALRCVSSGRAFPVCRVCRVVFKDLARHHALTECGEFDRKGMWWTPNRPTNFAPPRTEIQEELFKEPTP